MKQYDLNNPCHKRTYSLAGAVSALALASNDHDPKDRPKRFYYCDICRLYHLTSMTLDQYLEVKERQKCQELTATQIRKRRQRKNKNRPKRKVDML